MSHSRRIGFRGDTRGPDEIFRSGFVTRKEDAPIIYDKGYAIDPNTAICFSWRMSVASIFPQKELSWRYTDDDTWIYVINVDVSESNLFDTHRRQVVNDAAVTKKFWYADEVAVKEVKAEDILFAVKVHRFRSGWQEDNDPTRNQMSEEKFAGMAFLEKLTLIQAEVNRLDELKVKALYRLTEIVPNPKVNPKLSQTLYNATKNFLEEELKSAENSKGYKVPLDVSGYLPSEPHLDDNAKAFRRLVKDNNDLIRACTLFPQGAETLINYLFKSVGEVKRVFYSPEKALKQPWYDLSVVLKAIPAHVDLILRSLFTNAVAAKEVFARYQDFTDLMYQLPELAPVILRYGMANHQLVDFLFKEKNNIEDIVRYLKKLDMRHSDIKEEGTLVAVYVAGLLKNDAELRRLIPDDEGLRKKCLECFTQEQADRLQKRWEEVRVQNKGGFPFFAEREDKSVDSVHVIKKRYGPV